MSKPISHNCLISQLPEVAITVEANKKLTVVGRITVPTPKMLMSLSPEPVTVLGYMAKTELKLQVELMLLIS